jgi:high-affinity nickel-transport protein
MFIVTWAAALMFWKFGRVEEKWSARLRPVSGPDEIPAHSRVGGD